MLEKAVLCRHLAPEQVWFWFCFFFNRGTIDLLGQMILCCGGLSGALQDVYSIPGPFSLDARSPPAVTKETIPKYCRMFSGHILSAVGNHCTSKTSQPERQRGLKERNCSRNLLWDALKAQKKPPSSAVSPGHSSDKVSHHVSWQRARI